MRLPVWGHAKDQSADIRFAEGPYTPEFLEDTSLALEQSARDAGTSGLMALEAVEL